MTTSAPFRGPGYAPVRSAVPVLLAVLLVLTAIAYPLALVDRDVVSWTIVVLGSALSVVHAGSPAARGRRSACSCWWGDPPWRSRRWGWPPGSRTAGTPTATPSVPTLLGVPFLVPLAWLMMAWPAGSSPNGWPGRSGGSGARDPDRHATGVFAAWDVVLDPQMVQAGYWTWEHPRPGLPGIDTVPLTNLAGWLLAGSSDDPARPAGRRSSVRDAPRIGRWHHCSRWAG